MLLQQPQLSVLSPAALSPTANTEQTHSAPPALLPLQTAITALQALCDSAPDQALWLAGSKPILQALIATSDWLPPSHAASHPQFYQQHALHIDAAQRFSISSFVWGPGQGTPVHNHTMAGWVGVLRGAEWCQRYSADGQHTRGAEQRLHPGDVDAVTPHDEAIGDVHTVRNGLADGISISIHIYRGNIAGTARSVFKDGLEKVFVSAYSTAPVLL
jgi:3-mercaptopropionate dioxygenase